MSNRQDARSRGQFLKSLREKHQESVTRTQTALKEQNALRRQICTVMREGPKTIPEIAAGTGLAADLVLWHVMAMKKYDLVVESGMCGEYYQYQMAEDRKR